MIKLYTKKTYNHASISFDRQLSAVYSFGRKQVWNPLNGGFVEEDIKRGLFKNADCVLYSLAVTEDQLEKMKNVVQQFVARKERYRYNFLGLFGIMLNRPVERDRAFFCSQFVAYVLEKGCGIKFDKPVSLIVPGDLEMLSELKKEYEGKIRGFYNMHPFQVRQAGIIH